jgi:regulatory protein YycH of two-component signal transduction system YycFG
VNSIKEIENISEELNGPFSFLVEDPPNKLTYWQQFPLSIFQKF